MYLLIQFIGQFIKYVKLKSRIPDVFSKISHKHPPPHFFQSAVELCDSELVLVECSHVDAVPVHHGEGRAECKSKDLSLLADLRAYPRLWS